MDTDMQSLDQVLNYLNTQVEKTHTRLVSQLKNMSSLVDASEQDVSQARVNLGIATKKSEVLGVLQDRCKGFATGGTYKDLELWYSKVVEETLEELKSSLSEIYVLTSPVLDVGGNLAEESAPHTPPKEDKEKKSLQRGQRDTSGGTAASGLVPLPKLKVYLSETYLTFLAKHTEKVGW